MRHFQPSPAKSTAENPPPEEEAAKYKKKLESLLEAHHSLRASEQSARDRIGRLLDRQKQDQWAMGKYVELLAENRALKADLDALQSRVSEESAAAASLTSKCEELEAVIVFLDDEIASARANARRCEELEARVGAIGGLERTIEELRARVLISEAESASSARKLMEEEAAIGRLKRRCEELEARVLSLEVEKCEKLNAVVVLLEDGSTGSARKLMKEEVAMCNEKMVGEVEEKGGEIAPQIIEIDDHSSSEKDFVKILTPNRSRVSKEEDDEDNTPIARLMKRGDGRNVDRKIEDVLEDFGDGYVRTPMPSSTRRRKFASRVVTSDSEDGDDDDNIPISKLKRPRTREAGEESEQCCPVENVTPMRRLVRSGEEGTPTGDLAGRNLSHTKTSRRYPREQSTVRRRLGYSCLDSEDDDEEKGDDVEIDSDGDNIDEFIVSGSGSDSLEAHSTTSDSFEAPSISDESTSDVDIALGNVLDKYYRKMNVKRWEYETDMLASFPKDPQLCMTAVCALYRQQTAEEQKLKGTIVINGRGFNQFDAVRGSMIAEFLLDGDTNGPVKKTVEELEMRYPGGLDYCLTLACRYSKQLFAIYQQKEDPYFSS